MPVNDTILCHVALRLAFILLLVVAARFAPERPREEMGAAAPAFSLQAHPFSRLREKVAFASAKVG